MFDSESEHFTYTRIIQAPAEPVVEPVERLVATGGQWEGDFEYYYFETTSEGRFLYGMVNQGSTNRYDGSDRFDFEYDPSDGKFYDIGSCHPYLWGIDANKNGISAFPTTSNMQTHFWYNDSDNTLIFQFDNPYYVPPEPVERIVATAGNFSSTTDYYYFSTTSDGRYLYGLVDKDSTTRIAVGNATDWDVEYDPINGKFYDAGPKEPFKWGTDDTGANLSDVPTTANMETLYWYDDNGSLNFQIENPYYGA